MGWITKRCQQTGSKLGGGISEEKRQAPLRKISYFVRRRTGLFDHHRVVLECGHEALCYGETRARCLDCLRKPDK